MNDLQDTEDVEEDLPKFVQEYSENSQREGLGRILDVCDNLIGLINHEHWIHEYRNPFSI